MIKFDFQNQKGATSVLIVTFILSIILLVSLSAATIMTSEIKMSRQLADSIPAFYAADSGAERCLFQARCVEDDIPSAECEAQTGPSLNQFCAKKTNGDQISSLTEAIALANSPVYTAQRDQEERIWASGNFRGTKRSVEIEWNDLPPCVPQCDGKACGADDECGGVCPATCNTLPGCYNNNPNPVGNVIADLTKTCCQGKTCYTCPAGFVWNAGLGQCRPDCAGVYQGGFCWYMAGWGESCASYCSAHGGVDSRIDQWAVGSDICSAALYLTGEASMTRCNQFGETSTSGHFYPAWCPYFPPGTYNWFWKVVDPYGSGNLYVPDINETNPSCRKACACAR